MIRLETITYVRNTVCSYTFKLVATVPSPLFLSHNETARLPSTQADLLIAKAAIKSVSLEEWQSARFDSTKITLRGETRPHSKELYWYAFKKINQKTKKIYIGRFLTPEKLTEVIERFDAMSSNLEIERE